MKRTLALVFVVGALAAIARLRSRPSTPASSPPTERVVLAPLASSVSFARALGPRAFAWPEDHGPHFDYQTEWWYYTGNVRAADGAAFGYQLTIFRRGLAPGAPDPAAGLATNRSTSPTSASPMRAGEPTRRPSAGAGARRASRAPPARRSASSSRTGAPTRSRPPRASSGWSRRTRGTLWT